MDSYTRTGLSVLSDDGSDGADAYRASIRHLAAWAEANAALRGQGLLSARPAPGKAGTFYRATDDAAGIVYYDDGTAWTSIGTSAAVDAAAGVGSLRTLGAGALQAAAGNHTHGIGAIIGAGDAAAKNTGTVAGTVAAGNHTHAGLSPTVAQKTADTSRSSTTTVAADSDLSVTLTAGTWRISLLLGYLAQTTGDLKWSWAFTGTYSSCVRGVLGESTGTSSSSPSTAGQWFLAPTDAVSVGGNNRDTFAREDTVIVVTGSGTWTFQWAQATSAAGASTVYAGSTIIADKIA